MKIDSIVQISADFYDKGENAIYDELDSFSIVPVFADAWSADDVSKPLLGAVDGIMCQDSVITTPIWMVTFNCITESNNFNTICAIEYLISEFGSDHLVEQEYHNIIKLLEEHRDATGEDQFTMLTAWNATQRRGRDPEDDELIPNLIGRVRLQDIQVEVIDV